MLPHYSGVELKGYGLTIDVTHLLDSTPEQVSIDLSRFDNLIYKNTHKHTLTHISHTHTHTLSLSLSPFSANHSQGLVLGSVASSL
jgi:hypothetical protein